MNLKIEQKLPGSFVINSKNIDIVVILSSASEIAHIGGIVGVPCLTRIDIEKHLKTRREIRLAHKKQHLFEVVLDRELLEIVRELGPHDHREAERAEHLGIDDARVEESGQHKELLLTVQTQEPVVFEFANVGALQRHHLGLFVVRARQEHLLLDRIVFVFN